jgi:hypothetical protein
MTDACVPTKSDAVHTSTRTTGFESKLSMTAWKARQALIRQPPWRRLDQYHAAIAHNDLAGDVVGISRGEEGTNAG